MFLLSPWQPGDDDDLPMEDPNAKEAEASAPPLEHMDSISGYDNTNFDGGTWRVLSKVEFRKELIKSVELHSIKVIK